MLWMLYFPLYIIVERWYTLSCTCITYFSKMGDKSRADFRRGFCYLEGDVCEKD